MGFAVVPLVSLAPAGAGVGGRRNFRSGSAAAQSVDTVSATFFR